MAFVATITRHIYGESGTELPPPVVEQRSLTITSNFYETEGEFRLKVQSYGMRMRQEAEVMPPRPYSRVDGISWSVRRIDKRPADFEPKRVTQERAQISEGV